MKRLLLCGLLCCCAAGAADQMTVFGAADVVNFEVFGLKVNRFGAAALETMPRETELRVCEALDNSRLVVFASQFPLKGFAALFDRPAVATSMRGVLERGGTLFFGPMPWAVVAAFPGSMKNFAAGAGLTLTPLANYHAEKTTSGGELYLNAQPADAYPGAWLRQPNAAPAVKAIRHFGKLDNTPYKSLFIDKKHAMTVMVIQEDIAAGGTAIFSYAYDMFQQADHPFWRNVMEHVYGARPTVSARDQVRARFATAPAPASAASAFTLTLDATPKTVALRDWAKPDSAAQPTTVAASFADDKLVFHFRCAEPDPAGLVRAITRRDNSVWNDDNVTVVLTDGAGQGAAVMQFIVNPAGVTYEAKNGAAGWNPDFRVRARVLDDAWKAKFEIPVAELGLGDGAFRLNFGREDKRGKVVASWSETSVFAEVPKMGWATLNPKVTLPPAEAVRAAGGEVKLWTLPAFTRVFQDTFPEASQPDCDRLAVRVARNEKEGMALLVSNTTGENLRFRIEPRPLLDDKTTPFAAVFTIKEAIPWRAATGQVFSEALTNLNDAGILAVAAYETRLLWIEAKTDLPAGDYNGGFALVPVDADRPTREIALAATVLPLRFPDRLPLHIYTFGPYSFSWARGQALRDAYWDACLAYHINWLQTSDGPRRLFDDDGAIASRPGDYLSEEARLLELDVHWVYGYGVYARFKKEMAARGGEGATPDSSAFWENFGLWMKRWAAALEGAGVGFDRFLVPLQDEPHAENVAELVRAAAVIHEVEPRFRLTVTIATWGTLDDTIQPLAPGMAVWMPWEPRLTSRATSAKELAFFKNEGKPFWPYLCSTSGNTSDYLAYFRFRGIRSFLMGADGFTLWANNSWRGNDWKSSEDTRKDGAFLFHHGDRGPIPTIRAEAFREAAEDLYLLREAARYDDAELKRLIDPARLHRLMAANQPAEVAQWRDDLLAALSRVAGDK